LPRETVEYDNAAALTGRRDAARGKHVECCS
jgi:hypothetical protein